jgi:thioesterase domain-containing protein/acyl carrier protein
VQACAVLVDDSGSRLIAFVVAAESQVLSAQEFIDFAKTKLPSYMIPGAVNFVEALPTNAAGKIDRNALAGMKVFGNFEVREVREPRDDIERGLLEIWKQVLGIDSIGIDQSFFELGGHSLLAVQMFSHVERQLKIPVDVRSFFSEPSIEHLAHSARKVTETQSSEEAPHSRGNSTRPVVESHEEATVIALQSEGRGVPLFCICGIDLYRHLAKSLGRAQPVYGVFLPVEARMIEEFSKGNQVRSLPTVEEMAKGYIEAIRRQHPVGPYSLTGVSFGGVLAYEIARQFAAEGEVVGTLALMESFLSRSIVRREWPWLQSQAAKVMEAPGRVLRKGIDQATRRLLDWQRNRDVERVVSMDDLADADFGALRWQAYHNAANKYDLVADSYEGSAVLFRAEQQPDRRGFFVDSTYGWADLVQGGLELHTVPGDHLGILKPPHVGLLARKMLPYLHRANELYGGG